MDGKEERESDKITAFDALFTTNHLRKCKALLSYLPPSLQKTLAVYIKFSELQYTLAFFRARPAKHAFFHADSSGFSQMMDDISPYLSPREQSQCAQIRQMMQNMEQMQEMMEMMEMVKSLFPEGIPGVAGMPDMDSMPEVQGMPGVQGMPFDPAMLAQIMQMMQTMNTMPNATQEAESDTELH